MIKQFVLITLVMNISIALCAQSKNSQLLSGVDNESGAKKFFKANPNLNGKLFTLNSGSDTSLVDLAVYEQKPGYSFPVGNYFYKIIKLDSVISFRASYIFLDGTQLSMKDIDRIRKEVVKKYQSGTPFFELVSQYSMDGNLTGDTRWFTEGMMVAGFEKEIKDHKKGDIFFVDTPQNNWYHVVLKTFDDTYIKTVTLLKINSQD